ncbi:MAG: polysaccharide deacetylase family protein [Nitrospirales bacterium]|nr:polysaccharide deacetylase family protein [Nitrospira sp.]MDR4501909.1 polysaccharide deacetylase family protein [Nitrospirales bacterium]
MDRWKAIGLRVLGLCLYRVGLFLLLTRWVDRVQKKSTETHALSFPCVQKRTLNPVQILMYHGISDAWSPFLPTEPIELFRNHLQYLSTYCNVLTLDEATERMKCRDVPNRAVVITIDDGYRDSYLNAFPLLREMGLPATVFLATVCTGSESLLWHDRACWMISHTTVPSLEGYGSQARYELTTPEAKRAAQAGVLWYLRSLEDRERIQALEQLSEILGLPEDPKLDSRLMLNWQEVEEMYKGGVQFGAHTVNHPILSKLPLSSVIDEVRKSKDMIEQNLGARVTTFAYPSGRPEDYNQEIKDIVKQEGFSCAVSTVRGQNYEGDDLFDLKRMGYWDHDSGVFGLRFEYTRFCV